MTHRAAPGGDRVSSPCIVAVDDETDARERIVGALERRYGADYRIAGYASASSALEALARMREEGEAVAVVLADQWMPEATTASCSPRRASTTPRRGAAC